MTITTTTQAAVKVLWQEQQAILDKAWSMVMDNTLSPELYHQVGEVRNALGAEYYRQEEILNPTPDELDCGCLLSDGGCMCRDLEGEATERAAHQEYALGWSEAEVEASYDAFIKAHS